MIEYLAQDKYDDMYTQLMAITQEALENAYYETAYHVLLAAMHLAHATSDENRLQAVIETAKTQLAWIDEHDPTHRMSSQSSVERSGVNLYKSLLSQAHADLLLVRNQHRLEQLPHLPWFGDTNNRNL
jgi:hypothetical protein